MAEEQSTTAPVEAQTVRACDTREEDMTSLSDPQTTAPEATTEPTAEAPKTVTEGDEGE